MFCMLIGLLRRSIGVRGFSNFLGLHGTVIENRSQTPFSEIIENTISHPSPKDFYAPARVHLKLKKYKPILPLVRNSKESKQIQIFAPTIYFERSAYPVNFLNIITQ